jgi:hypothetical protein
MATATPNIPGDTSAAPAPAPAGPGQRFRAFRDRHHLAFEVAFFFAGFLFDVVLLHRIDSTPLLIHQGTYLVLTGLLVFWDHRLTVAGREPEGWVGRVASYRLWVMHFFLGTLLNAFIVFYFRSSSGLFGALFIVALAAVIVVNELPRFRSKGPVVRVALLSFSVTSYLAYLLPVLWGELRAWQYVVAVLLGSLATVGLWRFFARFTHDPNWTIRRAVAPGLIVQVTLLALYFAEAIPPVPLSVKHLGIYNAIEVEKGELKRTYRLRFQAAPWWRFWARTQSTLRAGPGDRAWAFVRVFAPTRFQDRVSFAWDYLDPKAGWTAWGKPFSTSLTGGNEEGFRTFAYTTPARSGSYRVRVLTADDREIGRETFEVEVSKVPLSLQLSEEVD